MTTISPIRADPSRVQHASFKDYGIRFLFGGVVTALVGVLAKAFGPEVAGLFLAFPAILVASLTLIGNKDGTRASGADAYGAAVGSIGLVAFGAVVWAYAARTSAVAVLIAASVVWLVVSLLTWAGLDLYRRHGREGETQAHSQRA
jgi:uncharacterized membrane protein (GlpM family)